MTFSSPPLLSSASVNPPPHLCPPESAAEDLSGPKITELQLQNMSLCPSVTNNVCPGLAAPANSNSSSLMRFIDSVQFSVHHAMYYFNESSDPDVWARLAEQLFKYRTEEVDFYLPQLVIFLLRGDERTRCLLHYLSFRVNSSLRVATQLAWLLDTHTGFASNWNVGGALRLLNSYSVLPSTTVTSSRSIRGTKKPQKEEEEEEEEENGRSSSSADSLSCLQEREKDDQMSTNAAIQNGDPLMMHKRAASDLTFINISGAQSGDQVDCSIETASEFEKSNCENGEYREVKKCTRNNTWIRTSLYQSATSHSDTYLHVRPPRARQPRNLAPTSFSAGLLGLPVDQTRQLSRLLDGLSDFLDAAETASDTPSKPVRSVPLLYHQEWDFVNSLLSISSRLTKFASKEQRTCHLQAQLNKLNLGLPARVWLPVEIREHIVLRIPPSAAVCLNSAEKAPYLVYVEVLICNDVVTTSLPQRTTSTHPDPPPSIQPHCYAVHSPKLTSFASKSCPITAKTTTAPDGVGLVSIYSGTGDIMSSSRPGAMQSSYEDPLTMTPEIESPETDKRTPIVLYVNAKEIRRRLEQNAACQPQRSFESDPEDPSVVVLKEPWEKKAERIRKSSPWGHLPGWQLTAAVVKVGDDLRQEQLAYQLLNKLKQIWMRCMVELWLRPLNIVLASSHSGLIELVQDTVSLHQIRRHARISLRDYIIREHGPPGSLGFMAAQKNFVQSCAAYCLVGYLFQVKDRHNGNILVDKAGHVVHIDYGFMLSASPGRNLGFEMSPFKLTAEQVGLMDGLESDMFIYYKFLILRGLLAARKYMDELILLVDIARTAYPDLPCFASDGGAQTVEALRQRFLLTSTEEQVDRFVDRMIRQSLNSLTTRLYDNYQYYANGIQ